jgi:ubiquinone/menaquinone biosynthesis C-methylase UbiE
VDDFYERVILMASNRQPVNEQFANSDKLNVRLYLNNKFRTNPYPWSAWVFDQFEKQDNYQILELGCGTGTLWRVNAKRIPNTWKITVSDYSEGMLNETRKNLADLDVKINFKVIDAEEINLPDSSFDLVIANNMLYIVSNREKAFAEIKRILKHNGVFYAATKGAKDMSELRALLKPFNDLPSVSGITNFTLENGRDQLKNYYSNIEIRKYDDSLEITEVEPIINFYLSLNGISEGKVFLKEEKIAEFRQCLTEKLKKEGKILVTKDTGIFLCRK